MTLKTVEKVVLVLIILGILWIGLNRTFFVGRVNWADDYIWANRWDRVLAGQLPYRDFFELYGPGLPLLLAPLYDLFGRGLAASRVIQFVLLPLLFLGVLQVVFYVLNINARWRIIGILWTLLLFGGIAWLGAVPVRIWFGIGMLPPLAIAIKNKNQPGIFVAGMLSVFVGLLSTEQGVATMLAGMTCLLLYRQVRQFLIPFLLGIGLAGLVSVMGMSAAGMLRPYIQTALLRVPLYQNAAYGFSFPGDDVFHHPLRLFWYLPFLLWIFEVVWSIKNRRQVTIPVVWLLAFAFVSLRVYLGRTEIQSLAIALVPQTIVGVWIVASYFNRLPLRRQSKLPRLALSVFVPLSLGVSFLLLNSLDPYWRSILFHTLRPGGRNQLVFSKEVGVWLYPTEAEEIHQVITYLRVNEKPGEAVYPYAVISGFSTILQTITPNYFEQSWFAQTADDQRRLTAELEQKKVPWVIYSRRDDVIRLNQLSRNYILSVFRSVATFGDYSILHRNSTVEVQPSVNPRILMLPLIGSSGTSRSGDTWEISHQNPSWETEVPASTSVVSTVIVDYQLHFFPGAAALSKTALEVTAVSEDGETESAFYQEPFLLPGGWQEAWVELPKAIVIRKLRLRLFWPGGLNPQATGVEWGEIRLI
jgi:hypothetical protein